MLSDGCLPYFSGDIWEQFLRAWEKNVYQFVPGFKAFRILVRDQVSMTHYDLDSMMSIRGFGRVLIHAKHQVLTAVLTPEACSQCHNTICRRMKINLAPNELVLARVRTLSHRDTTHQHRDTKHQRQSVTTSRAAAGLKCANYGCSLRRQKPNIGAVRVVTGSWGVSILTGAPETMLASLFSSFYHDDCPLPQ